MHAYGIIKELPIRTVEALISPEPRLGLAPPPQGVNSAGMHPVIFFMGRQKGVSPYGVPVFDLRYMEAAVSIPWVTFKQSGANAVHHIYSPHLYLDRWFPILLGRFYGYAKHRAAMAWDNASPHPVPNQPVPPAPYNLPTTYLIDDWDSYDPVAKAVFTPDPAVNWFNPFTHASAQAGRLKTYLEMPMIGRFHLLWRKLWFLCSNFDWRIGQPETHARLLDGATVRVYNSPLIRVPAGDYTVGAGSQTEFAFEIVSNWTLSWPHICRP